LTDFPHYLQIGYATQKGKFKYKILSDIGLTDRRGNQPIEPAKGSRPSAWL